MKGVSDVVVLMPNAKCILFECKTDIGYQSKEQKVFEATAISLGLPYHVFRSKQQFQELMTPYILAAGLEVKNG